MKGIVLAGGSGTRLHPLTYALSKQLLPVYNKPMVYYPLSVLFLASIRDIMIISTPHDLPLFERLLGDGSRFGVRFSYAVQESPKGIAEAFIIAKDFIGQDSVALILGDNIFYGNQLQQLLKKGLKQNSGATIFAYQVKDAKRYGVVELDKEGNPLSIEEKPLAPKSSYAVTGLYMYDSDIVNIAKSLKPSYRGELEITDVNRIYLERGNLTVQVMGRGFAWLDMGTYETLLQAGQYIQVLEERQGLFVGALEEVAYNQGWISSGDLRALSQTMGASNYAQYLQELL